MQRDRGRVWEALVGHGGDVLPARPLAAPAVRDGAALLRLTAPAVRCVRLLTESPRVSSWPVAALAVTTHGWRFPQPPPLHQPQASARAWGHQDPRLRFGLVQQQPRQGRKTLLRPPADAVTLKERLLYLLQPPLDNLLASRRMNLPCNPFPYQMEGVAFLMPRWSAVLADEMGLGKTMQAILALRLLLHGGLIRTALIVCPKPLVANWARELRLWADDLPFEIIAGDTAARRIGWRVSNCPIKLVNYELLTRDAEQLEADVRFDLVILDEAQRIKNHSAKTAQAVRGITRERGWALTGTPIENRPDDLISIFAFVKPGQVPADTPARRLPDLTADHILRRVKEDVLTDLPPKMIRDAAIELTPEQRQAYDLAESEGVIRLNQMGDTITVQHVFELILRLKQICNFDPLTGASAKLEQLHADVAEIAASGRKAIVFSQWVEPLEILAGSAPRPPGEGAGVRGLAEFGTLLFHGRVPAPQRTSVLERFRDDRTKHVLLMSYGAGSVGLNLQCANYVFLFDRWWNPAVEDQAINRAHRIGQKEPVFVTRFVAQNTIEERICAVLEKKRQLFHELIEANAAPASLGMSEEEIFALFNLAARPSRGRASGASATPAG